MQIDKKILKNKSDINFVENMFYNTIKRFYDLFFSILGIIIILPFLLIVSILIKVDDPTGKVFFSQDRVGKNGKVFKMYKFRSMCSDAETKLEELIHLNEINGSMFKIKGDPRITNVGKIIRKYSIDELPQLINVVKGDMSLVGPRPALPREVKKYSEYDKNRLLIVPGITGLWQVSGRNALSFDEMVKLDLNYIDNRSIMNDMIIIIKTIREVIFPESAY